MKTLEIQPTQENVKKMFINDAIDRNSDVIRFCNILNSIEGCYSIALDGKWGSGKTFFIKQVKMVLDAYNTCICTPLEESDANQIKKALAQIKIAPNNGFEFQPHVAVYYDAWANDNDEDPILSLIYAILQSADTDFKIGRKREILKIVSSIGDFFTGKRISSFLDEIKGEDPLILVKSEKSIHKMMNEFFDKLLFEHGNRLVIFIDELDRCKPSYAIQLLERVKHYFGDERVTFVFSINSEQLQHTIKRYYGEQFNASGYLDRFFDLRMSLPPANMEKFYKIIAFSGKDYVYDEICHLVIESYHFEMRQIARFIHLAKIAAYKPTHENEIRYPFVNGRTLQFSLMYIVPIMIGLRIYDESVYTDFVSGKNGSPLFDFYYGDISDFTYARELLGANETYNKNNVDKEAILVSVKDKLKDLYEAIFVQDYSGNIRFRTIGNLNFNSSIKRFIMRIVSLLSDEADYS